jgi:hypothetical protein
MVGLWAHAVVGQAAVSEQTSEQGLADGEPLSRHARADTAPAAALTFSTNNCSPIRHPTRIFCLRDQDLADVGKASHAVVQEAVNAGVLDIVLPVWRDGRRARLARAPRELCAVAGSPAG